MTGILVGLIWTIGLYSSILTSSFGTSFITSFFGSSYLISSNLTSNFGSSNFTSTLISSYFNSSIFFSSMTGNGLDTFCSSSTANETIDIQGIYFQFLKEPDNYSSGTHCSLAGYSISD